MVALSCRSATSCRFRSTPSLSSVISRFDVEVAKSRAVSFGVDVAIGRDNGTSRTFLISVTKSGSTVAAFDQERYSSFRSWTKCISGETLVKRAPPVKNAVSFWNSPSSHIEILGVDDLIKIPPVCSMRPLNTLKVYPNE